jgi:hypothetical protein
MSMVSDWPPEFDGIKIVNKTLLCRVKDTDVWVKVDLNDPFWVDHLRSQRNLPPLLEWLEIW